MFKCEYKLNCTNTAVDLILNSIIIQLINHISSAVCTKTFYFFCSLHKHFLFLLQSAQTLFISSEVCTNTFYFFCSLHKHFLFLLQSAQTLFISSEVCTNTFFFLSLHKHFLFLLKSAQTLFISSEVCTNTFYIICSLHKHFLRSKYVLICQQF